MTQHENGMRDSAAVDVRQTYDTSSSEGQKGACCLHTVLCDTPPPCPVATIDTVCQGNGLSSAEHTPYLVLRTGADIGTPADEFLGIYFQSPERADGKPNKAHDRTAGDVFLVDFARSREMHFDEAGKHSVLVLLVRKSRVPFHPSFHGVILTDQKSGSAIGSCLQLMRDRFTSATQKELSHLFDAAIALLNARLVGDQSDVSEGCSTTSGTQKRVLQAIQGYIDRNINDSALTIVRIADHFGISSRYVQKLFAAAGTTFKAYVRTARLNGVHRELLDPACAQDSAGDIACRWGYRDMTTFHRNFKQRFGDTPGQVRNRDAVVPT